jgi:hypothetical protein
MWNPLRHRLRVCLYVPWMDSACTALGRDLLNTALLAERIA